MLKKAFDEIEQTFRIRYLNKLGKKETYVNMIKVINDKPILSSERLNFSLSTPKWSISQYIKKILSFLYLTRLIFLVLIRLLVWWARADNNWIILAKFKCILFLENNFIWLFEMTVNEYNFRAFEAQLDKLCSLDLYFSF